VKLTKQVIDNTPPFQSKDRYLWDKSPAGFGVRIRPSGTKTFIYAYRPRGGRRDSKKRLVIGQYGNITLDQARKIAQEAAGQVAAGRDPMEERQAARKALKRQKLTVQIVANQFVEEYAKPRNRTWGEYDRILTYYVRPKIGDRSIHSLTKADINSFLATIGKENGRPMADHVLAVLRKMMNWHEVRDDEFRSPIVKGMALTSPSQMKRDRFLTDDEIRAVWKALEKEPYPFGPLVKLLFLTAQRREDVAAAQWVELQDGHWLVPSIRYKSVKPHLVPLAAAAQEVIQGLSETGPFLFTTTGATPFSGFSKAKARLDKSSGVYDWRLHDIRRTSRTLMVRAGVRPDIAERVLGHAIPGVAGVYDQYDYAAEKREALNKLATLLKGITSKTETSTAFVCSFKEHPAAGELYGGDEKKKAA
jgi:integrase